MQNATGAGTIVPGKSIDGIKLGDGQARVRKVLGPPPHTQAGPPGSGVVRWDYTAHNHLTVLLDHAKVASIFVSALPRSGRVFDRTTKGIRLGSTMIAASNAYPGACYFPKPAGTAPPVCSFQRGSGRMTFMTSGRYGMGAKAPIETIQLQLIR